MERPERTKKSPNNISTEDILKALDSFGERGNSPGLERPKAANRDSGVSESCSSLVSDPLSSPNDAQSFISDGSERLSFASDTFSVISDPLGAYSTSDGEGDNEIHCFTTKPWDERQSLEQEWKLLFSPRNYYQELSNHALAGKLKYSKYRSIAWKLFLECLPEEQSEWMTKTKQLRHEYETFKQKCLIDPNKPPNDDDSLHIFNPLSLEENSPWKQYFQDNELKNMINQDLNRLYPEISFFHSSKIKDMMLSLLFCYVKRNESLGYKQGMHELLAPIVYVLESECRTHQYMEGDCLEVCRCLMDPAFVEHDAFSMFCQLMEVTEAWYQHQKPALDSNNSKFVGSPEPFTEPLTTPPTAIVKKLNKIQDHLLRKHDPDLWLHMKELNIAPQVYGLRWIRLLFSREFPFLDVLVIWDALLAEGSHLDLVEYIYIAMLQTIRHKLIAGNYSTCMGHLMKFPRVHDDVVLYVKRAINLRGAKKKPRPSSPASSSTKGAQRPNMQIADRVDSSPGKHPYKRSSPRRPHSALSALTKRYAPFNDSRQLAHEHGDSAHEEELIHRSIRPKRPDSLSPPLMRERTDSSTSIGPSSGRTMKSFGSELKTKLTRPRSRSRQGVEELEKDHQRLQTQVSHLNTDVERMQGLYLYCGRKLDSYIGLLQEEVMKDTHADRDVVYLSLAGLKQVRDLLKGTLSYRGSSMETEKDFIDIDKGIATRLQISSPNVCFPDAVPVPLLSEHNHHDKATSINASLGDLLDITTTDKPDDLNGRQIENVNEPNEEVVPSATSCNDSLRAQTEQLQNTSIETQDHSARGKGLGSQADERGHVENSTMTVRQSGNSSEDLSRSQNVSSLDSYLKDHFGGASDIQKTTHITAVLCATGPELGETKTTSDLVQPCGGNQGNEANQATGSLQDFTGILKDSSGTLRDTTTVSCHSNVLTPDEPLEGFVFVNKDGSARGDQRSLRLSPVHPLDSTDDEHSHHYI